MLLISTMIIVYLTSFLLINVEMEMERMYYKMLDDDIDKEGLWVARTLSIMPIINTIIILCFIIFEKENVFLLENKKEANKMYKCLKCGVLQRRHQQKGYKYHTESRYSNKKTVKDSCCKECGENVVRIDLYDEKDIVMAEKANLYKSTMKMMQGISEFKKELKMEEMKGKMEDVEINDKQLEAYTKLYERRMNQYMEHAQRIKKDLEKAGKKVEV